jgi:hypothetical protein
MNYLIDMTKDELLTIINKYCKINDIYTQGDGYLLKKINKFSDYEARDLQLVISIGRKCVISIMPYNDLFTETTIFKQILIKQMLRSELLLELLKND